MLSSLVNSQSQPRGAIYQLDLSPLTFLRKNRFCKSLVFYALRTLPSSVSCKSFACHSYENNRGVAKLFPKWNFASALQGVSPLLGARQPCPQLLGVTIHHPLSSFDTLTLRR